MPKVSVIGICGKSTFMYVDHFHEEGETLSADSVYEEIGGKGINQAVAASRMNAEVSFLGAVGDDEAGNESLKVITENGIKAFLKVKKGKATPFAVILTDKNGSNRVTVYKSAELSPEDVMSFESEIASSDVLLLQNEVPEEVNETAVLLAEKHKVKVILNPAPVRNISDVIANKVFAVTPNEQEKQAIESKRFLNCITTLGKDGCVVNDKFLIPAIPVKPVDTTGAGDTFNGVLAVCIAQDKDLAESAKYAVAASGISVGKKYVLNSIPFFEEIERKMKNE